MKSIARDLGPAAALVHPLTLVLSLGLDSLRFGALCFRPTAAVVAENLFLRKQLALYQECHVKPRRLTDAARVALVLLAKVFDWREALVVVRPQTLIRWHRQGFRWFWRRKSRPGRPALPRDLQALIRRLASDNPTWGEERLANELLLKLGLQVSPRTVRKYLPKRSNPGPGHRASDQRWMTFVRNHAEATVACDFCITVTATFKILYVFIVIEHISRKLLYSNVTTHPSAQWTLQQLREAIPSGHAYRFLIHDRDSIFSHALDQSIRNLGLRVLKTRLELPRPMVSASEPLDRYAASVWTW